MRYILGILVLSLVSCKGSTPTKQPQADEDAAGPGNRIPVVTLSANGLSLEKNHKGHPDKPGMESLGHESSAAALLRAASKSSIPQMRIATREGVATQMALTIRDESLKEEKRARVAYVLLADNSTWVWHSAEEFHIPTVAGEYDWTAIQQELGSPEGSKPVGVLFVVAHESASVQELVKLFDSARQANFAYVSLGDSDGNLFGSAGKYLLKPVPWPLPRQEGVTIQGSIAQELVEKYLDAKRPELQACYEKERSTLKELDGTLNARFTIASNGRTSDAEVSGMGSSALHNCLRTILSEVRYPRQQEQTTVNYSLVFGSMKKKKKVKVRVK